MKTTESAGPLLCEGIANVVGPSRIAVMDQGCRWLLPSLLMSEMAPVIVSWGDGESLEREYPGVARYGSLADAQKAGRLDALLISESAAVDGMIPWRTAGATSVLLVLSADYPEVRVQALLEQAAAQGWGQHPRQSTANQPGDARFAVGYRILAFAQPGLDAVQQTHRDRIARTELISGFVRAGDRTLVVARDAGQPERVLASLTHASSVETREPDDVSARGLPGPDLDFVLVELGAEAGNGDQLTAITACLARGGRLAVVIDNCHIHETSRVMEKLRTLGMEIEHVWVQRSPAEDDATQPAVIELVTGATDTSAGSRAASYLILSMRTAEPPKVPARTVPSNRPTEQVPNILAFERDYDDPAIVRLIVSIGLRAESADVRRDIAQKYLHDSAADSADAGAALCVLCYDWLTEPSRSGAEALFEQGRRYLSLVPRNPTVFRWKVSLAFAMALMSQRLGRREDAASFHGFVVSQDVLEFSPLLGTKTVASLLALGWSAYADGDVLRARDFWKRGVLEAKRLVAFEDWSEVLGSLEAPETFGMPELSLILEEAGRAAAALKISSFDPDGRGKVWEAASQSRQARLRRSELALAGSRAWLSQLQQGKDWLDRQCESLSRSCAQARNDLSRQQEVIAALQESKEWLANQYDTLSRSSAQAREAFEELQAANAALREGKDWLENQYEAHSRFSAEAREALAELQAANAVLQDGKDWLELQYRDLSAQLDSARAGYEKLQTHVAALQVGKDWLEAQYETLLARVEEAQARASSAEAKCVGVAAAFRLAHIDHVKQLDAARSQADLARARSRYREEAAASILRELLSAHASAPSFPETAYGDLLSALDSAWVHPAHGAEAPNDVSSATWAEVGLLAERLLEGDLRKRLAVTSLIERMEKMLALNDEKGGRGMLERLERMTFVLENLPFLRVVAVVYAWVRNRFRRENGC